MCLILIACGAHPDFPLVIAANRDEYYQRPTAQAAYWKDHSHILAGRDLECMGTWLGVTRDGRFAALTNYRDARQPKADAPSRGHLVGNFLLSDLDPRSYLDEIRIAAPRYNGFNLLAGDTESVFCFSNRESTVHKLPPGIHGLSNHLLDTPWPKVVRGKQRLQQALARGPDADALLDLLHDREPAPESELPDTGIGIERERMLSPALIVSPLYGTRSSTALLFGSDGSVGFTERTILPGGHVGPSVSLSFSLNR
jgi:uncharacterized protein with NRDE domain